ncbi:MAG: MFS transporter [Paludibacteraceae bacterium]|nr:MFS transporter [Paludibacteraceae bacterium]
METKQNNSLRIMTIVAMMFLYGMIAFVTNLAAPVGKIWEQSFTGSHAQFMGMLGNAMNFLAYLIMGIPAGLMLSKAGYKKTALIAVFVGFIGIFFQYLSGVFDSFVVYLFGAFVCGFSVCMLNTVVNPLLTLMGGGGKKGNQLNLIGGTINSLAGSLTPMLVGALIGAELSGKEIDDVNLILYIAMAVFAVVYLVIRITPIAEPEGAGQEVVYERSAWTFRHFVLGAVAILLYMGVEIGIPATLISYMTPKVGFAVAGFIAGRYWLLMLVGRFIGSAIGGKISSRAMLIAAASMTVALILAAMCLGDSVMVKTFIQGGVLEVPVASTLLVLTGLFTSIMWGCIFNLSVEGLGKYTAKASGIFMTMVFGGAIWPSLQAAIAGHIGILISYIVPLLCAAYILFYAAWGSKNVNKDIKID